MFSLTEKKTEKKKNYMDRNMFSTLFLKEKSNCINSILNNVFVFILSKVSFHVVFILPQPRSLYIRRSDLLQNIKGMLEITLSTFGIWSGML